MIIMEETKEVSNRKYYVKLKIVNSLEAEPIFKEYFDISASTSEEAERTARNLYKLEREGQKNV